MTISRNFLFAKASIIFACFTVGLMAYLPLDSDDLYMYLNLGRRIIANDIPLIDPYLYSMPDFQWHVMHEWASYLFFYGAYLIFGFQGISLLNAAFIFGLFSFASCKAIQHGLTLLFPVIIAGGFASSLRFSPKASQFSELFLIVLLQFLILIPSQKRRVWLISFPVLFLIWAQFHPGFILGLALLFLYLISIIIENYGRKNPDISVIGSGKIALLLLVSTLACVIHPDGVNSLVYPLKKALDSDWNLFRLTLFEWKPTFAQGALHVPEVLALCFVWTMAFFLLSEAFIGTKSFHCCLFFSLSSWAPRRFDSSPSQFLVRWSLWRIRRVSCLGLRDSVIDPSS